MEGLIARSSYAEVMWRSFGCGERGSERRCANPEVTTMFKWFIYMDID